MWAIIAPMEPLKNLFLFAQNPIKLLDREFTQGHPKVVRLKLLHKNFILVFDPNLSYEVLVQRSEVFIQNRKIFDRIKPVTGDRGLVQLNGRESQDKRKLVRPMFSAENLVGMAKIVNENSIQEFTGLKEGRYEINEIMVQLVLKNAFEMFLGIKVHECPEIAQEFQELNKLCGGKMKSLMATPSLRIKRLRRSLRSKVQEKLSKSKPSSKNIHQIFEHDETLIDQAMTFLFAGHETTASSLTFTLLLIAQYPELQTQISKGNEEIALRVYQESLRLFPPAYMLAREAAQDTKVLNLNVKKGDQIIIGIKQIHSHPEFFKDPKAFNHERDFNTKAFLPFGKGPKNCVGEKLAYVEAVSILKSFCERFTFTSEKSQIHYKPHITLHPAAGQFLEIRRRVYE